MKRKILHKILVRDHGSLADAADKLGVTRQWLWAICNGAACGPKLAFKLQDATGGIVDVIDLIQEAHNG